jgi:hypothetical protein
MSDEPGARPGQGAEYTPTTGRPASWGRLPIFAALLLMLAGGATLISGLVALAKDEVPASDPIVLDPTAWGWLAIVVGALGILVGLGVLAGQRWAVAGGIAFAVVNALSHVAFIPPYPLRSVLLIALDAVIVYALAAHGRDLKA